MLRYRAAQLRRGEVPRLQQELTETDRNGKLAGLAAPLANWAGRTGNALTRPLLEKVAGVDRRAALPKFHGKTLVLRAMEGKPEVNREAPAFGRKVVLYATCFANYNNPSIGTAALAVLAKNGVECEIVYPACCGCRSWSRATLPASPMARGASARRSFPGSRKATTWWRRCRPAPSC
jgi:glycerol-3-phosphate dehydrogenase subunit C